MLTKKPKYSYEMHTAFHAGCIKQFAGLNTQQICQDIFAKKTGIAPHPVGRGRYRCAKYRIAAAEAEHSSLGADSMICRNQP